jgi:hypothetical protein
LNCSRVQEVIKQYQNTAGKKKKKTESYSALNEA